MGNEQRRTEVVWRQPRLRVTAPRVHGHPQWWMVPGPASGPGHGQLRQSYWVYLCGSAGFSEIIMSCTINCNGAVAAQHPEQQWDL